MQDLRWDDVRLFLALTRAESLGDAARALGVDGSTVSRRLSALEETLGATLFDRGRSGITATDAAEALMTVAEEIELGMARFTGRAETFEREVAGKVRITCPPDAAEALIVPLLPKLLARHPNLAIELDAGAALLDVARRATDLALRIVKPDRGDLVVTRLMAVEWVVAAAPTLAAELGTLRAWQDVPWVGFSDRFADAAPARWFARHVTAPARFSSASMRVQIAFVGAGLGIGLVPATSVQHYGLRPVKLTKRLRQQLVELPASDLYLVTHQALRRVPRVRAVWDHLVAEAGVSSRRRGRGGNA